MLFRQAMLILFVAARCYAATFYTAVTGSDYNPGTYSSPFKTITRGALTLRPGDVLLVGPGTYAEALIDAIPPGQDWSLPVTIRGQDPSSRPIIRPVNGTSRVVQLEAFHYLGPSVHHVVLDSFILDGHNVQYEALKISGLATEIHILNCEIAYAPSSGIVVENTPGYVQLSGLDVHDNGRTYLDHGIYVAASNNIIENSRFHDNAGWGVHVYLGTGEIHNDVVRNNKCYYNSKAGGYGAGIGLYSGTGHVAKNNSVWGNRDGIHIDFGATGASVESNEVLNNRNYGIIVGSGSSFTRLVTNTVLGQPVNIHDNSGSAVIFGNTSN